MNAIEEKKGDEIRKESGLEVLRSMMKTDPRLPGYELKEDTFHQKNETIGIIYNTSSIQFKTDLSIADPTLKPDYIMPLDSGWVRNPRKYTIKIHETDVTIIAWHAPFTNHDSRWMQLNNLKTERDKLKGDVIIVGDLNIDGDKLKNNYEMTLLKDLAKEDVKANPNTDHGNDTSIVSLHLDKGTTFAKETRSCYDHILMLKCDKFKGGTGEILAGDKGVSDHKPLFRVFTKNR